MAAQYQLNDYDHEGENDEYLPCFSLDDINMMFIVNLFTVDNLSRVSNNGVLDLMIDNEIQTFCQYNAEDVIVG